MCEWLSSGDWFDVQLSCGGRAFSAHRAVLASASTFLRKILLSCPTEESPVFIFLPDFDHDAMCSLLHYIYNGEVSLPRYKLKMFLDIANAMEINIDQQCLLKMNDHLQYIQSEGIGGKAKNYDIYQLKQAKDVCCINKNNGVRIEDFLYKLQQSLTYVGFCDNPQRYIKWSQGKVPDFRSLVTQTVFHERKSLPRDLFLETNSKNGYVNGLTEGVMAISNEYYRSPTSVLLRNANATHPSASDTLSDTSKSTSLRDPDIACVFDSFKHMHNIPICINYTHDDLNIKQNFRNKLINNQKNNLNECKRVLSLDMCSKIFPIYSSSSSSEASRRKTRFPLGISSTGEKSSVYTLHTSKGCEMSTLKNSNNISDQIILEDSIFNNTNRMQTGFNSRKTKVTILNEALQCPWRACQPNNFKPFRKRPESTFQPKRKCENEKIEEKSIRKIIEIPLKIEDYGISSEHCKNKCNEQGYSNVETYDSQVQKQNLSVNRYSCAECHKTFSQLRNYKYHMSVHRGTKEFATTCPVCGKQFNDRGYLSSHMKIHKNRKEYKCGSCPKSFNQRVAYNMHVRIHTGVKPHVCEECGKAFSRKMLLKQHQRTHSGERPYACEYCNKRFADRSNMTLHLRLHTGVKPFSCTMCPKSFTKKHHLKAHLNFHTGAKPFSCPRCKLTFTQSSNMRTHYKKCNVPITYDN